ncbi:acyl-CoA thioesterase [Neobacillus drentensis]|uniref:acyl-CoA thioesterase n=1 Tax=Neobacillus drentensis TaxID=220684 RepID=UPI003001FD8F
MGRHGFGGAEIIYYPNYFKWFDIASYHLFHKIGLYPKELMLEEKIGFGSLDVGCTFKKPLLYGDQIRVRTMVTEVNNKTFRLEHEINRGDELAGKGFELRGWIKFDEGKTKAYPIPDDARIKLTQVGVKRFTPTEII